MKTKEKNKIMFEIQMEHNRLDFALSFGSITKAEYDAKNADLYAKYNSLKEECEK